MQYLHGQGTDLRIEDLHGCTGFGVQTARASHFSITSHVLDQSICIVHVSNVDAPVQRSGAPGERCAHRSTGAAIKLRWWAVLALPL